MPAGQVTRRIELRSPFSSTTLARNFLMAGESWPSLQPSGGWHHAHAHGGKRSGSNSGGPVLTVTARAFTSFVAGVKTDEFGAV